MMKDNNTKGCSRSSHPRVKDLTGAEWRKRKPSAERDIRRLKEGFFTRDAAEVERVERCNILLHKPLIQHEERDSLDRSMLRIMSAARPGISAAIGCCPVLARRFQIAFVDAAMKVHDEHRASGSPFFGTFLDLDAATRSLKAVDVRKSHDKLRHRLQTNLGKEIVVVGFLEVEWDRTRKKWQPHHHVVLYGADENGLKKLRAKHYQNEEGREGPRPMRVIRKVPFVPGLFAYMSKLTAFAKIPRKGRQSGRVRLRPPQARDFMRFLAIHRPTEFVFCINASVVKERRTID